VDESVLVLSAPSNQTNCPGTTATFSLNVSGTSLSYQWYKGNSLLSGQTTTSLLLPGVSAADADTYSVVVSGECGSVTNSAILVVNAITTASPLSDLVRCPGDNASFSTVSSGTGPFTYVWDKDGTVLPAETSDTLVLTAVSAADAGSYHVIVT